VAFDRAQHLKELFALQSTPCRFAQGVESIVIAPETRCDDHGERIYYYGCGSDAKQLASCRAALAASAVSQRPVRVVRVASGNAAALALRAARLNANRRRDVYRYDGLYTVRRNAAMDDGFDSGRGRGNVGTDLAHSEAAMDANNSEMAAATSGEMGFLLLRLASQPALPQGAGNAQRRGKRPACALVEGEGDSTAATLSKRAMVDTLPRTPSLSFVAVEQCAAEGIILREVRTIRHERATLRRRHPPAGPVMPWCRASFDCLLPSHARLYSLLSAGIAPPRRGARGSAATADRTRRVRDFQALSDQPATLTLSY